MGLWVSIYLSLARARVCGPAVSLSRARGGGGGRARASSAVRRVSRDSSRLAPREPPRETQERPDGLYGPPYGPYGGAADAPRERERGSLVRAPSL